MTQAVSGTTQVPRTPLAALDRAMAVAEFTPDGHLCNANDNYLSILGIERADALGRHHRSLYPPSFANDPQYDAFWNHLLQGGHHTGIVERIRGDGGSCWLQATWTPIADGDGKIATILEIATDISERIDDERRQRDQLQRLSLVADTSDTAISINDGDSRIVYVNAGFTRMFGWTSDQVLGRNFITLLASSIESERVEIARSRLLSGQALQLEEMVTSRNGQRYWINLVSNPVLDEHGCLRHTINMLTDITLSKVNETLLHQVLEAMAREQPLTEVLELICQEVERIAPDIRASILSVDEDGRLHPLAAPSLPQDYNRTLENLPIGPDVGSCGTAAWRNETVCVDDIATDPLWESHREHTLSLGLRGCWSTPIRDSRGRVIGTFALYFPGKRNESSVVFHQRLIDACTHLSSLALERENARRRIRQLAYHDSLTGLPNRSLLQARADQAIALAAKDNEPLAVLFVDLNRFKQINDSLGHPAGDDLLRQIAERLHDEMGVSDIAGRLSGDEFVVVLPRCDADTATQFVERLQTRIAEPTTINDTSLSISASIGIAMFPSDGRDMENLLHRSDMAMYQAKTVGRGNFRFFSKEMNELAQERLALETALKAALRDGGLHFHYQPQVELAGNRLYGVEALARWTHPQFGRVPPARFIPLAEECGLMADLGRWALAEACRQLCQWRAKGIAVPTVSVNLSPTSFHNLDLPRMIADTLRDNELEPHDLTLELTEDILLDSNPSTMQTIAEVQAQGVRLSMDDFGSGYSSLGYLRRLPVSELKLDRSFVADLERDEASRALSSAILSIGRSLNLTVVAEGVETPSQEIMLREQGYPAAQGNLFSPPLAPSDLECWMARTLSPPMPYADQDDGR